MTCLVQHVSSFLIDTVSIESLLDFFDTKITNVGIQQRKNPTSNPVGTGTRNRAGIPIASSWLLVCMGLWVATAVGATSTSYSTYFPAVAAFAAAKKNSSKGKKGSGGGAAASSSSKGFGTPTPLLKEVLAKFPSRIPPNPASLPCPCGGTPEKPTYGQCCGPLHDQTQTCTTITDVLRSRYSAFCWRTIGHIIETTHESCRDWRDDKIAWAKDLNQDGMFDSFEFVQLDILGSEEPGSHDNEGFLEFQVTLRGRDENDSLRIGGGNGRRSVAAVSGLETVVKERSRFLRNPETGVWSYASGDVSSKVAGLAGTKLNN